MTDTPETIDIDAADRKKALFAAAGAMQDACIRAERARSELTFAAMSDHNVVREHLRAVEADIRLVRVYLTQAASGADVAAIVYGNTIGSRADS